MKTILFEKGDEDLFAALYAGLLADDRPIAGPAALRSFTRVMEILEGVSEGNDKADSLVQELQGTAGSTTFRVVVVNRRMKMNGSKPLQIKLEDGDFEFVRKRLSGVGWSPLVAIAANRLLVGKFGGG